MKVSKNKCHNKDQMLRHSEKQGRSKQKENDSNCLSTKKNSMQLTK